MVDGLVGYLALARRSSGLADQGIGPFLDLGIRLSIADTFWNSAIVKLSNWPVTLEFAYSEGPVSWMDQAAAVWLGLGIELICPVLLASGLFTWWATLLPIALSLISEYEYLALLEPKPPCYKAMGSMTTIGQNSQSPIGACSPLGHASLVALGPCPYYLPGRRMKPALRDSRVGLSLSDLSAQYPADHKSRKLIAPQGPSRLLPGRVWFAPRILGGSFHGRSRL